MNASRFFRSVWRVNGLLVLLAFVLAGGAAIVAAVAAAVAFVADDDRRLEPVVARAADGAPLELGDVQDVLVFHRRGEDHLVARVDLASRKVTRTTELPAP
jgi:hypothetical protein